MLLSTLFLFETHNWFNILLSTYLLSVEELHIDIAKKIADYLNKELVIKDVAFDSIINEVKTSKSDIGAAGISYTEERSREVDFTVNYFESRQIIIVKKDSNRYYLKIN